MRSFPPRTKEEHQQAEAKRRRAPWLDRANIIAGWISIPCLVISLVALGISWREANAAEDAAASAAQQADLAAQANNLAAEQILTPMARLTTTRSSFELQYGDDAHFNVTARNTGSVALDGLRLRTGEGVVCWTINGEESSDLALPLDDGGTASAECRVSGMWDPEESPELAVTAYSEEHDAVLDEAFLQVTPTTSQLSVELATIDDIDAALVGHTIVGELTVTNAGTRAATGLTVSGSASCEELAESISPGETADAVTCSFHIDAPGSNTWSATVSANNFEDAEAEVSVVGETPVCPELLTTVSDTDDLAPENALAFVDGQRFDSDQLRARIAHVVDRLDTAACPLFDNAELTFSEPDGQENRRCRTTYMSLGERSEATLSINCETGQVNARPRSASGVSLDNVTLSVLTMAITGHSDAANLVLSAGLQSTERVFGCHPIAGQAPAGWFLKRAIDGWAFELCPA